MPRARTKDGKLELQVTSELLDVRKDDETPDVVAYAFTPGGALIDRSPVRDDKASLSIPARDDAQSVRIVIGPLVEAPEGEALAELLRLRASERFVRIERDVPEVQVELRPPRLDWLCWLIGRCFVRGTLLKRVSSGGVPIDLPVCGAEVEIYEVDPLPVLIERIPIDILERLREIVRFPPPPPPPPPPPDGLFPPPPGPEPDPSPIDELIAQSQLTFGSSSPEVSPAPVGGDFVTRAELSQLAEERFSQREGPPAPVEAEDEVARTFTLIPEAPAVPDRAEAYSAIHSLAESSEIRVAASQGLQPFRAELLRNPVLVRPLLCIFFPPLVTTQLVATATTDDCGRFQAVFSQGCSSDTPDLYFVAYGRLWFFRVPIYQPQPIACNTWWDYACGTEVTLYTSSPFAHTCPPCRPVVAGRHWVLVMAIGNTPLSRIHGTSANPSLVATATNVGLTDGGAPFGGLVRLRLEFDNSLRDDLNVCYYRVSWKRAGTTNPFVPLDLEVHRHYAHMVGTTLVLDAYSLGPRTVNGTPALYEIPPPLPPLGQWAIPDAVEDTTSAKFPTGGSQPPFGLVPPAAAGVYKLRVDLFDADGNAVDIGALGIHFVVPTSANLAGTIQTAEAASLGLVPGPPVDTGSAFVMRMRVDNNPTFAQIAPPLVNGSVAADACGVLRYPLTPTPPTPPTPAGSVTLAYTASHPNGFATRSFGLRRGATPVDVPLLTASGAPVGAGSYSASPAVSTLLSPGCAVAGFAESLYVAGTATDGWGRLGYDASDLRAFVLAPPP